MMKPEQQRIKIAEVCLNHSLDVYRTSEGDINTAALPNYLNDLNAMYEAIYITLRSVDGRKFELFCSYLWAIMLRERKPHCICSNASEQAEAFLKTLNLWEDEN